MSKLKIYISIPIKGLDEQKQRHKADLIARRLSTQGYEPVNPFNIYAGKNADYYDHICADLRALADCDGIYMCDGWERSNGCGHEHDFVLREQISGNKVYKIIYES